MARLTTCSGVYNFDAKCSQETYPLVDCSDGCYQCFHNSTTNARSIGSVLISNVELSCSLSDIFIVFCSSGDASSCKTIIAGATPSTVSGKYCYASPIQNAKYVKHFCLQGKYTNPPVGCSTKYYVN